MLENLFIMLDKFSDQTKRGAQHYARKHLRLELWEQRIDAAPSEKYIPFDNVSDIGEHDLCMKFIGLELYLND